MLFMVEQVVNTGHAKSQAFVLLRIGVASGPAQIDGPIPSRPGPRSNLKRIVGMHQQNFHERMNMRTRSAQASWQSQASTRSTISYDKPIIENRGHIKAWAPDAIQ